jgi:two-component system sensor histidine kinase UhpB
VIYRVAQESLTNVIRHAAASHAEVELTGDGAGVTLRIRDDGRGLSEAREGSGITGMRERALLIGARLTVAAASGGTEVRLEIPAAEVIA